MFHVEEPVGCLGRDQEVEALTQLFARYRLVTVIGASGIGKTSFASEWSRRHAAKFTAVWHCDLEEAKSVADVEAAIASAAGFAPTASDMLRRVGDASAAAKILIMLDDVTHAVTHVRKVAIRFLRQSTDVHFLITSQRALGSDQEVLFQLDPLSESVSLQLLVAKARRQQPGWQPEAGQDANLKRIVHQLEGLPLAIELAAARLPLVGPARMAEMLSVGLSELASANPEHARHATLWRAFEDSWQLLGPEEQRVLGQCAVFHSGFFYDDAAAILAGANDLAILQTLRERSLLRAAPIAGFDRPRLYLLEALRAFLKEKLGRDAPLADRHAQHFLARFEPLLPRADRTSTAESRELCLETANLLAACKHLRRRGDDIFLRMVAVADLALRRQGPYDRRLALLVEALQVAKGRRDNAATAFLYLTYTNALMINGNLVEAAEEAKQAVKRATGTGAKWRAAAFSAHALALVERGLWREGAAEFKKVLACTDSPLAAATKNFARIIIALLQDDLAALNRLCERTAAAGESVHLAHALVSRGMLALIRGHFARALVDFDAAQSLAQRIGAVVIEAGAEMFRGYALWLLDDRARAEDAFRAGLAAELKLGLRRYEAATAAALAGLCLRDGRFHEADALLKRAKLVAESGPGLWTENIVRCHRIAWLAEAGSLADTEAEWKIAKRIPAAYAAPYNPAFLALTEGFVLLARAKAVKGKNKRQLVAKLIADANERLRSPKIAMGEHRCFATILAAAIERHGQTTALTVGIHLVVAKDWQWFQRRGETRVDLSKRVPLRRLLQRLIEVHAVQPGHAIAATDITTFVWPEVKTLKGVGDNRLYNALSTLRRFAGRDLVVSHKDGYMLNPTCVVER